MREKRKRLLWVLLAVLAAVVIILGVSAALAGSHSQATGQNAVGTALSPVQQLFSDAGSAVSGFFRFIGEARGYEEENAQLRAQVQQLEQQNRDYETYRQENQRLRQLLELKEGLEEYDTVGCEVIAKDSSNWFQEFTIDKGADHQIAVNDVVLSGTGLAGRVSEVGTNWARVVSIIDTESSVGAEVTRSEALGVVDGDMTLADEGKCRLSYVMEGSGFAVGDTVVTSGIGGIYPKGLLIGTIEEVVPDTLAPYAVVDTAVDFSQIREVLVIRSGGESVVQEP